MIETPKWLPPAHSKRWSVRRYWDPMGYLRVRTLANAAWPRDVDWLLTSFVASQKNPDTYPAPTPPEIELLDAVMAAGRSYKRLKRRGNESAAAFEDRQEQAWDSFLATWDAYLAEHQAGHLRAVREAGGSGDQIPHDDAQR